mgnify:CR=1 FL=1
MKSANLTAYSFDAPFSHAKKIFLFDENVSFVLQKVI